jgi:hypothetical protein
MSAIRYMSCIASVHDDTGVPIVFFKLPPFVTLLRLPFAHSLVQGLPGVGPAHHDLAYHWAEAAIAVSV